MTPRSVVPEIHKFGGAALANADTIRGTIKIIASLEHPKTIVVSAIGGVTDLLFEMVARAQAGKVTEALELIEQFRAVHQQIANKLLPSSGRPKPTKEITQASEELMALARALGVLNESSARIRDHVVARGERLSASLLATALSSKGMPAEAVDPAAVIITDGPYGAASPNLAATQTAAQKVLGPLLESQITPVIPGFLGRAPDGGTATLGRGGSDLTATSLGAAMKVKEVTLWKDVPGLLTADPRVVNDARLLTYVHPSEAAELAYYGAKVLHPRALLPLAGTSVHLRVRPFADPTASGTEISTRREAEPPPVRSLSAVREQALVTVSGSGILGVPGMSARTFGALQGAAISVSLIAQASSEYTIDFTVPADSADEAVRVLRDAFRHEIEHGELDQVKARKNVSIVAVVGLQMAGHPGIAARVFEALEAAEVNVVAIAQGSAEHNISVVVDEQAVTPALRRIHAAFQLGKAGGGWPRRRSGKDVVLLGAGLIGRAVLKMLIATPERFASLRLVAVVDRNGVYFKSSGIESGEIREILASKEAGRSVAILEGGRQCTPIQALADLSERALIRPVVVDVTADDTSQMLTNLAATGFDLVLANKRPLTGTQQSWQLLRQRLKEGGGRLRHEATVCAGLPTVLATNQLIGTGDKILRLEGCLSGTLGVVLSALESGMAFSAAVKKARLDGLTEPDPREDLNGLDVARKALILARMLGQERELEEIKLTSMLKRGSHGKLNNWLDELSKDDDWWANEARRAAESGKVLRYVATVTPRRADVGLKSLSPEHPLGQLRGGANRLVVASRRYTEPLVITGPGAGPEVTATGVLADLLSLTGA